jgi:hypothetical protein
VMSPPVGRRAPIRSRAAPTVAPRRAAAPIDWSRSRHEAATIKSGQIGRRTRREHHSLILTAIKCATHSGSTVGRKIRGPAYPRPIPMGFHAFHKPDFPPSQIRLCVAGFMTRFVLHDIQVEARARDKKERGQRLFGLSLFSVSPYAREVPSTVNSGQVRLTCRDDEGCAPLPGRSLPQCKNPPMVHPDLGIAETA